MDFTLSAYKELLTSLLNQGYTFQTFEKFLVNPKPKAIVLRHDVDLLPRNSLTTAQIENNMGICGSYYFRITDKSFNVSIIKQIAALGHEIGYHYETMDSCHGNIDLAYEEFKTNLNKFRQILPVSTVCMHGSPLSKYDNRKIWDKYSYRQLGIIGEPYYDVDFSSVLYLTDTGRRWDGDKVSVRDKVNVSGEISHFDHYEMHSTYDIIKALKARKLPEKIMINVHPQRWTANYFAWLKELILQNVKNQIKRIIVRKRNINFNHFC